LNIDHTNAPLDAAQTVLSFAQLNRLVAEPQFAGTKTNVCCESTGRDAMMLDFKVVMVSDCCAALSDDEHLATLETFIQQFGDVMSWKDVVERLDPSLPLGPA
jgi:nicotinamidase-related amidase